MKKIGLFIFAITSAMTFTACGRSTESTSNPTESAAASAPESSGEPIMLHARIEYSGGSTAHEMGKSGTTMSLEILQPAFRTGKGKTASYSQDISAPALVQGYVHGSGHAEINSDDHHMEEHYDKTGGWHPLGIPDKGYFSIMVPEPSDIGDGLQIEVEVHAPVTGAQWARAFGQETAEAELATPLECTERDEHLEDHSAACGVKFRIDAKPTGPKSDAGKILYDSTVQALAQPNGEWAMALLGQLYGAETTYEEDGHFVLHVKKQYSFNKEGSIIDRDIDITVWSSRRDSSWTPSGVTPVKLL